MSRINSNSENGRLIVTKGQITPHIDPVHTGTQSFRSISVPLSGTQKLTVHTGTERLRIGFCFCSHGNAIVPFHNFLFSPCPFFQQQQHPRMRSGQKFYRSGFWTSLAPHYLFTRERNSTIAYRSTFRITYFIVPLFGTERCYFKRSRVNATPEHSTFRNGTIWNGTIAFPCERGHSNPDLEIFKISRIWRFFEGLSKIFLEFQRPFRFLDFRKLDKFRDFQRFLRFGMIQRDVARFSRTSRSVRLSKNFRKIFCEFASSLP